jgi:hypothetical protein
VGLGLTYAGFVGGFYRAKTVRRASDQSADFYPVLLHLLDQWWNGTPVRAVSVSLDMLEASNGKQLSFFEDVVRRHRLSQTVDAIRLAYGETRLMRAVSLTKAGQLRDRGRKIGGHFM